MREIKFRGKRIDNGEWVEGSLYREGDSDAFILTSLTCIDSFMQAYGEAIEPETVGQFTGHITVDGVGIYEGDIVRDGYGQVAVVRCGMGTQKGHLGTGGFYSTYLCVRSKHGGYEHLNKMSFLGMRVLGNVVDNPELLGGDGDA